MKRSVLIDGRLIGYRHGGIANYARRLAEHVPGIAVELDVRVAVRRRVPDLEDRAVRVLSPPHHRLERISFGAEVIARRADLVHSTDYIQPIAPGVRTLVTVHDLAFIEHPELMTDDALAYYGQLRRTVHSSTRIIAVSNWTRRQLNVHLGVPNDRVTVIPNGVEHSLFTPERDADCELIERLHPALPSALASGRPVILAVSTVEPRKRIDLLIDAINILHEQLDQSPAPLLVVAGQSGWRVEQLVEKLRALQRRDRAIWLRGISDHELAAVYRASTLMTMPSLDEGFGLPVLEAMASGTPVLVSGNGALPELVGDAGFVEQSDNASDWAKRIRSILDDEPSRQEYSCRGIERARRYSWELTAQRTVDVYREVLQQQ